MFTLEYFKWCALIVFDLLAIYMVWQHIFKPFIVFIYRDYVEWKLIRQCEEIRRKSAELKKQKQIEEDER
jgi:hypothetical protein